MSLGYPPNTIVRVLLDEFFPRRGLRAAPRSLAADGAARRFTDDEIVNDMEQFGYVRLDAAREAPRGARDWVVVLVLGARGRYAAHGPDLRKLLEGVAADRLAVAGRLDELIVVAEEEFFGKKNLTDVVGEFQATERRGVDAEGATPRFNAYPYHIFAHVVPANQSVPPHRLMDAPEAATMLERERLSERDLPAIAASDPPVIWLGGREGQVVEITRPSQTALQAMYYRRIERRAFF
ncbi:MAG: DNA-directed RNA polymerase subunit RpoH/Rpb5 C-terminal domain-containing protein [Gemmatimonadaceae bacterium]|jgi:DNA-directed RNA polymerase subunit H (RpoH/RPB5)